MITNHLDAQGLLVTYETMAGELAILRRRLVVDRPEIVGYAAGESHFEIVEAVFVSAEDAPTAQLALFGVAPADSVAGVLAARGIPFRTPEQPRSGSDTRTTRPDVTPAPQPATERPRHRVTVRRTSRRAGSRSSTPRRHGREVYAAHSVVDPEAAVIDTPTADRDAELPGPLGDDSGPPGRPVPPPPGGTVSKRPDRLLRRAAPAADPLAAAHRRDVRPALVDRQLAVQR